MNYKLIRKSRRELILVMALTFFLVVKRNKSQPELELNVTQPILEKSNKTEQRLVKIETTEQTLEKKQPIASYVPPSNCEYKLGKRIFYCWNSTKARHDYFEVWSSTYKPRNYELHDSCTTHPWLRLQNHDQFTPGYCKAVYKNWIETSNVRPTSAEFPSSLESEYSLGGLVSMNTRRPKHKTYIISENVTRLWSLKIIEEQVEKGRNGSNNHYKGDTQTVYSALNSVDITGKVVAVIGTEVPWLEGILLSRNALRVDTIEYTSITSDDPRVKTFLPMEVAHKFMNGTQEQYDFIASFSSIEHSGLGHYGDPFDPFGDVKEMQKCWCLLKPGGLMLLGFTLGWDIVMWNINRSYGPFRLPLMTAGFEVVNLFSNEKEPMDWKTLNDDQWIYAHTSGQKTMILKKVIE